MRFTITLALFASTLSIMAAPLPDGGSAYTGAGGSAIGGSKSENDYAGGLGSGLSALDIASGSAGHGGKATSGNAIGGNGRNGNGGSAYSGVGGNSNGGSVNENHYPAPYARELLGTGTGYGRYGHHGAGALNDAEVLDIASGNAGNGGDSSSGNAIGGSSFRN